jgi:predicted dinucleotide-binding enzyme
VAALGTAVSAGTSAQAAGCPVVVISAPWISVPTAVAQLTWSDQVVIDATNPPLVPDRRPADLAGRTSSEIVAELVAGARVVKAGNTPPAQVIGADPYEAGGRRAMFLSGDDAAAKATVAELFGAAGFWPIDLGCKAAIISSLRAERWPARTS